MKWNKDKIRLLRKELGLTQQQLAEKLGVNRVTVARWESGSREPNQEIKRRLTQLENDVTSENVTSNVTSEDEIVTSDVTSEDEIVTSDVTSEDEIVTSENVTNQIITPAEYFEAAYRDADGYIVLCTITQPTTETERGRLYVQGTYSHDSIPELLSDVNELNGQYHIYTNIHPLREPPQRGRGKESDILGVSLFATDTDFA